jgi:hypothetical protein
MIKTERGAAIQTIDEVITDLVSENRTTDLKHLADFALATRDGVHLKDTFTTHELRQLANQMRKELEPT